MSINPLLLMLTLFAGLVNTGETKTEGTLTTPLAITQPAAGETPNWKTTDGLYAEFNTTKGVIVCQLEYKKVPKTVGNFVALCEGKQTNSGKPVGQPFYDGIIFHRVLPNFMIQGGDVAAGNSGLRTTYTFADEFDPTLRHSGPGILSMANAGPATNSTQFFITHVATTWLNDKHSVFGHVVQGQDVVNAIAQGDKMNTVRIIRVGKEAKAFDGMKAFSGGDGGNKSEKH